jgi:hypothetical protein
MNPIRPIIASLFIFAGIQAYGQIWSEVTVPGVSWWGPIAISADGSKLIAFAAPVSRRCRFSLLTQTLPVSKLDVVHLASPAGAQIEIDAFGKQGNLPSPTTKPKCISPPTGHFSPVNFLLFLFFVPFV